MSVISGIYLFIQVSDLKNHKNTALKSNFQNDDVTNHTLESLFFPDRKKASAKRILRFIRNREKGYARLHQVEAALCDIRLSIPAETKLYTNHY